MDHASEDLASSQVRSSCILSCSNITKLYGSRIVLNDVSLQAHAGTLTCVVGPSGCGKSTLLTILGGLDTSYDGDVFANGLSLHTSTDTELNNYRRNDVGFIFQDFNLIEHLSVLENVATGLEIDGISRNKSLKLAKEALKRVNLTDRSDNFPNELSGGEAQRVAIARAIAKQPSIILADEPTGSLDIKSAQEVATQLRQLADNGACVVVVTHDVRLFAPLCDELIELLPNKDWEEEALELDEQGVLECGNNELSDNDSAENSPSEALILNNNEEASSSVRRHSNKSNMSAIIRMTLAHMITRKKRVITASLACMIGVLGFGLMFSLLFGTIEYGSDLQARLLANVPLTIKRDINIEADTFSSVEETKTNGEVIADGSLDDFVEQALLPESGSTMASVETILLEAQKEDPAILSVQAVYPFTNDIYVETKDGWRFIDRYTLYEDVVATADGSSMLAGTILDKMPEAKMLFRPLLSDNKNILEKKYDLLSGRMPTSPNEVVIVTRYDGTLSDIFMALLGYMDTNTLLDVIRDYNLSVAQGDEADDAGASEKEALSYIDPVSFDELLSLKLAILEACDYRVEEDGAWVNAWYKRNLLDVAIEQGTELEVVGVVAPRYALEQSYDSGYIGYLPSLTNELVAHTKTSPVVVAQEAQPDKNIQTGKPIIPQNQLAQKILSSNEFSFLGKRKLSYLKDLSDSRIHTLLRSLGINEDKVLKGDLSELEEFMQRARYSSYDEFVSTIESIAPLSLDNGLGPILDELDAYRPEDIQEILVYVDSLDEWERLLYGVEEFNKVRYENRLPTVSVAHSAEVSLFRQGIQIMSLVMLAFAVLSILVILVTISSTMGTFVAERSREIGCLRSMGMSKGEVGTLFVFEAIVIGLLAVVAAAVLLAISVSLLNGRVQEIMGATAMFKFDGITFGAMLLTSILLSALAGMIPARGAARKDPIAALRL